MWSGSINTIPTGWALCNGSNGTPDLRNRFIVGAGSTYSVGTTGGEATHTLTVSELPSHNHTYRMTVSSSGTKGTGAYGQYDWTTREEETGNTGGGQAHENRPPYYALCYIMKISN